MWAYVTGAEMQYVPAILTIDRLYINKSPATSVSSTLKNIIKPDDVVYIDGSVVSDDGFVKQSTVHLAWIGKKPKKIPITAETFLLHNEMVLGNVQDDGNFKDKLAAITYGIGKLKQSSDKIGEIEFFWEPKIKMKLDISNSSVSTISKFGDTKYVNFHAIEKEPAKWTPVKVWNENAEFTLKLSENLKMPVTQVPTLNWQRKEDASVKGSETECNNQELQHKFSKLNTKKL